MGRGWSTGGRSDQSRGANAGLAADAPQAFIAKVSMSVGYSDSWTNMIQPLWPLTFLPIIGAGSRLQARDIMGYTFVAMIWFLVIFAIGVTFLPV